MEFQRVIEFTRYNSGSHFLDSGGDSGRIWQGPAPENNPVNIEKDPYYCSINLTRLLSDCFTEDSFETERFELYASAKPDLSWFELVPDYLESLGFEQLARDNTYNGDNDLDQNFIYEVWNRPDSDRGIDWFYADCDSVLIVLYIHTGADIRGGYSKPLLGNFELSDYCMPFELSLDWYLEPLDGEELPLWAESLNDSGELSCGYSSHPISHAESIGITWGDDSLHNGKGFVVEMDGEKAIMVPSRQYYGE